MKRCAACHEAKEEGEFSWAVKGEKLSSRCKVCLAESKRRKRTADPERFRAASRRCHHKHRDERLQAMRERYDADPEYFRIRAREVRERSSEERKLDRQRYNLTYRLKLRAEMLLAYGSRCECCGEREPKFLTLDHVNNDGKEHRASMKGAQMGVYLDLKKRGWPKDGYRLLCWNCHMARSYYGDCPHRKGPQSLEPALVRAGEAA